MTPLPDMTGIQSNPVPDLQLTAGAGASHPTRMLSCLNSRSFLFLKSIQTFPLASTSPYSVWPRGYEIRDIRSVISHFSSSISPYLSYLSYLLTADCQRRHSLSSPRSLPVVLPCFRLRRQIASLPLVRSCPCTLHYYCRLNSISSSPSDIPQASASTLAFVSGYPSWASWSCSAEPSGRIESSHDTP